MRREFKIYPYYSFFSFFFFLLLQLFVLHLRNTTSIRTSPASCGNSTAIGNENRIKVAKTFSPRKSSYINSIFKLETNQQITKKEKKKRKTKLGKLYGRAKIVVEKNKIKKKSNRQKIVLEYEQRLQRSYIYSVSEKNTS